MRKEFDDIQVLEIPPLSYFSSYAQVEKCFKVLSAKYNIHARLRYWVKMFKTLQELDDWITSKNRHNDIVMTAADQDAIKYIWYTMMGQVHWKHSTGAWLWFTVGYWLGYYNT